MRKYFLDIVTVEKHRRKWVKTSLKMYEQEKIDKSIFLQEEKWYNTFSRSWNRKPDIHAA